MRYNRITAGIQPLLFFRLFDEPLGAFGKTREDVALRVKTTLIYRTDLFFGFAPTVTYTYTYNDSNIGLFDYVRHRLELGLTREF